MLLPAGGECPGDGRCRLGEDQGAGGAVLQLITDRDNPLEIDRLLVVTFTNAAAAEMKQRIGAALEKAIRENLALLTCAASFAAEQCADQHCPFLLPEVIRQYYYLRTLILPFVS